MSRGRKFAIDRANGKLLGVCAGMSEMTGWDVTLIRVALVAATCLGGFPWILLIYAVAAWIGRPRSDRAFDRPFAGAGERFRAPPPRTSAADLRGSMTDLDRRLAEVETFVTSPNHSLASEIEALR